MQVSFGSTEKTKIIDTEGSTEMVTTNFHNGSVSPPIKIRYHFKIRVRNQAEEDEQYKKFSEELKKDKTMLDPNWAFEHTKAGDDMGYYHVIKSYTRLSYDV